MTTLPPFRNIKVAQLFKGFGFIVLILIAIQWLGCTSNPGFDEVPSIQFLSFSKDTMEQGSLNTDSVFLKLTFEDGDGNIGTGASGITENIIITDNRNGDIFERFKIPDIEDVGAQNGIEGTITLKLFTTCCTFPDLTPPCANPPQYPSNEINFDIYMVDDAGNQSNIITTSTLTLLCN